MTRQELELEVAQLRWRVEIFETISVAFFAHFAAELDEDLRRRFVRGMVKSLDAVRKTAEEDLRSSAMFEEKRALLSKIFDQEIERMRRTFALPDPSL